MLNMSCRFMTHQMQSNIIIQHGAITNSLVQKEIALQAKEKVLFADTSLGKEVIERIKEQIDPLLIIDVECIESSKSREKLFELQDVLLESGITKDSVLIALGGGMLSDLITLLAATYLGGVGLCIIATTLLSMVDASIGGKGAVNACGLKNRIATFYPAKCVIIDPSFVMTQDERQYLSGIAEVIKYSLIQDLELFTLLEEKKDTILSKDLFLVEDIIKRCCMVKIRLCEIDPHDKAERRMLNFGHTIAHALEANESLSITHGEAVAFGMVIEAHISMQKGLLSIESLNRIYSLIDAFGFLFDRYASIPADKLYSLCLKDKKSSTKSARFVPLERIGKAHPCKGLYLENMTEEELQLAMQWQRDMLEKKNVLSLC